MGIALLGATQLMAQTYVSEKSNVRFFSDAPLEDIEAVSDKARGVFDADKGEFVFSIPIRSFQFKKKLMQEHFNENYLESDKFPNAVLSAKVKDWDKTMGKQSVVVEGEFEIHGVKQPVEISGDLDISEDKVEVNAVFPIALKDYDIEIPTAVFYKIAEVVEVTVNFQYKAHEN